jgi:hypothetical protein
MAEPQFAATVRSENYFIARATTRCRHCGMASSVWALALPGNHEVLDSEIPWQPAGASAVLFYVAHLPEAVQRRLRGLTALFRVAFSPATLNRYWANHCEHCDALLEDHELHCEPSAAFMPSNSFEAANILLTSIEEPFGAAAAGYAIEPEFFPFPRDA